MVVKEKKMAFSSEKKNIFPQNLFTIDRLDRLDRLNLA